MNTVELFAGTGSFSKVARARGHSIFRVEIDRSHEAELHKDILELQREDLPQHVDVIWCSPPCTTFSVASLRHYWNNGRPKNAKTWHGIAMVQKTIHLIKELQKDNPRLIWYIENPRGMLRKQSFMSEFKRHTITYCQYGDFRQKPTDIWTNDLEWSPRPMCKRGQACHASARRGSDRGSQWLHGAKARSVIPPGLFDEIMKSIEIDRSQRKDLNGLNAWIQA